MSSRPDSPHFAPMDPAEFLRRRAQSDLASAEIGSRLLKGWAMLADECPNTQCYGIPLVRPPKAGGERDPRKECVVCHHVYIDQVASNGIRNLVPMQSGSVQPSTSQLPSAFASSSVQSTTANRGLNNSQSSVPAATKLPTEATTYSSSPAEASQLRPAANLAGSPSGSTTILTLQHSATALESSLAALTDKLTSLSKGPVVDAVYIGQTADAMSKVSQALTHVKQLQWSETHAYIS